MKNVILKAITAVMAIVFLISMCSADSDTYLFFFTMIGSSAWLFLYANRLLERAVQ